jgi:hypothetical protein
MSDDDDENRLSGAENTEERGPLLPKVLSLVPLIAVILQLLELLLKLFGVIQ